MTRNTSINMTTKTTGSPELTQALLNLQDLEKGKWYKIVGSAWLVLFSSPDLNSQRIGVLKEENIFMFIGLGEHTVDVVNGMNHHRWAHLGSQELFAHASFRENIKFQEVAP